MDASFVFSSSDLFPKRAETTPTRQKIPRLGFFPFGLRGLERLSGPILSGFPPLILFLIYAHQGSFPRSSYTLGCHYRRHERGQRKFLGKDRKYSLSLSFVQQTGSIPCRCLSYNRPEVFLVAVLRTKKNHNTCHIIIVTNHMDSIYGCAKRIELHK